MSAYDLSKYFDFKANPLAIDDIAEFRKTLSAIRDDADFYLQDYEGLFAFLDGDIGTHLASEFAENFARNEKEWDILDKDAQDIMEGLRAKHANLYYGLSKREQANPEVKNARISLINDDLNEVATYFAQMAMYVDEPFIRREQLKPVI